jgi:SAM-dependent methyltransferase
VATGGDGPTDRPGARVSDRWAAWRAAADLHEYETRWQRLEASGEAVHGEADLVRSFEPRRVLDAGCGMGRVAIELARHGIDVVGADLDDDLLAVARRHAPQLRWSHADLAVDPLGGPYDVAVMAGSVMVFCRPADRRPIVANLATHLVPGGRLVAGFPLEATPGALTAAEYADACVAAGLVVEARWSTWDRVPFDEHASPPPSYVVVVARRAAVAER